MFTPYFARQIDQYHELLQTTHPDDTSLPLIISRAAMFAVHNTIIGHDPELLEQLVSRFSGTVLTAHVLQAKPQPVELGEYTLAYGSSSMFPHISFEGSPLKLGADPWGQPLFNFSPAGHSN